MSDIVILDTTVLLNVLDIPGFNQNQREIFEEFQECIDNGHTFLVPFAAIFETGNKIAQLANGGLRWQHAREFTAVVRSSLDGRAPWSVTAFPDLRTVAQWMNDFPNHATRGAGLSDLTIVYAWNDACARHRGQAGQDMVAGQALAGLRPAAVNCDCQSVCSVPPEDRAQLSIGICDSGGLSAEFRRVGPLTEPGHDGLVDQDAGMIHDRVFDPMARGDADGVRREHDGGGCSEVVRTQGCGCGQLSARFRSGRPEPG